MGISKNFKSQISNSKQSPMIKKRKYRFIVIENLRFVFCLIFGNCLFRVARYEKVKLNEEYSSICP